MRRQLPSAEAFVQGIRAGDRVLLGQAITLVESTRPEAAALARQVIAALMPTVAAGPSSFRIGITGAPGAGKSTLLDALGTLLLERGHRVAVLAIDPSSSISQGSILGDKTRMERLSTDLRAFVRPSPAGTTLGGVARATRESIVLVEAAGYDVVFVETVGVGQSEIAVHSMTDLLLLLLLPGAGDELQGIKRGIVEMADLLVVNKADSERVGLARQAQAHYRNALHLLPMKANGWTPQVLACSATEGTGIAELWAAMQAYQEQAVARSLFMENRRQQARYWLREALEQGIRARFYAQPEVQAALNALEQEVVAGRQSPFAAADQLLADF